MNQTSHIPNQPPKLYQDLASWWPLLSIPSDYEEEAAFFHKVLVEATDTPPQTLLELGSGGGNNASHLKKHFNLTLVDKSPQMLAVSHQLNPNCEHIEGDMRTVRLNRLFDAVFIHDAIDYMLTEEDLQQAMETAYIHCKTGGVALFVPDYTQETYQDTTNHGGHDGDGRALRYLEWTYDPDKTDTTYVMDFAYMLKEGKDTVHLEYDRHIVGLFKQATWLQLLNKVGFKTHVITDNYERKLFVGVKES